MEMSQKVIPIKECNICFDICELNEIKDLKCWSKDNDHIICKECFDKESNRRKEMGLQHPNECIICRPFQEHIENISINTINHITITYNSPYNVDIVRPLTRDDCINNCCIIFIIFFMFFMMSLIKN